MHLSTRSRLELPQDDGQQRYWDEDPVDGALRSRLVPAERRPSAYCDGEQWTDTSRMRQRCAAAVAASCPAATGLRSPVVQEEALHHPGRRSRRSSSPSAWPTPPAAATTPEPDAKPPGSLVREQRADPRPQAAVKATAPQHHDSCRCTAETVDPASQGGVVKGSRSTARPLIRGSPCAAGRIATIGDAAERRTSTTAGFEPRTASSRSTPRRRIRRQVRSAQGHRPLALGDGRRSTANVLRHAESVEGICST